MGAQREQKNGMNKQKKTANDITIMELENDAGIKKIEKLMQAAVKDPTAGGAAISRAQQGQFHCRHRRFRYHGRLEENVREPQDPRG